MTLKALPHIIAICGAIVMINEIIQMIEKKIRLKGSCTVGIDGRCGSGKSTLAKMLAEYFGSNVFRADDFYIPMNERDGQSVGNVDSIRLCKEVLEPLCARVDFCYRPYSCSEGRLLEPVGVKHKTVAIVEGSYSCQSDLFGFYDIRIFVDVGKAEQQKRLEAREGKAKLKVFQDRWIPMEEEYFAFTELKYKCEIYYKTSV